MICNNTVKISYEEEGGEYSHVSYFPNAISSKDYKSIQLWLQSISHWEQGETPHGKVPRQQLWYHKELQPFTRVWKEQHPRWQAHEYDSGAMKAHEIVNQCFLATKLCDKINFNSMLVNKYRNGLDTIAPHRDCVPEFGENPIVVCASIGSHRHITFQRLIYDQNNPCSMRPDRTVPPIRIKLEPRSLLVMSGSTQKYYCHGIEADSSIQSCRYSLTLREHSQI